MPPETYEEWTKRYEAEGQEAKRKFLEEHPDFTGEVWTSHEAEDLFRFINFTEGTPYVERISDGKRGYMGATNQYGPRLYYDFR